jgi:hypothetical protein
MTVLDKQQNTYIVSIQTPVGPTIVEDAKHWELAKFVGAHIATSRRNQVRGSNKIRVSALFTNRAHDA